MKKSVQFLLAILLLPALAFAQTRVAAADIIAQINRGETVSYKNARIEGVLDLTRLNNKTLRQDNNQGDNNTKFYVSKVTAPISFTNCTFNSPVLAYFNPNSMEIVNGVLKNITHLGNDNAKNEIYNTNFEKAVTFENCTFEQGSNFKYSEFNGPVSFAGSRFEKEAFFKYTKFEKTADFSKAQFENGAVFKYVKFPEQPNFSNATFTGDIDFKYTQFPQGVNFQKTQFKDFVNFKHTQFAEPLNLKGAAFKKEGDFKYTQLNGRKISIAYFLDKTE